MLKLLFLITRELHYFCGQVRYCMQLKEKILELLEQRKLTIKELAEKIGMSETGFHSTLKNNSFKYETMRKISDVLHVGIEHFGGSIWDKINEPSIHPMPSEEEMRRIERLPQNVAKRKRFEIEWNSMKSIKKKAGIAPIHNAIGSIDTLKDFFDEYYDEFLNIYLDEVKKKIKTKIEYNRTKQEIVDDILPELKEKLDFEKLEIKALIKLEKATINFFNEISKHVTKSNKRLYESLQDVKEELDI